MSAPPKYQPPSKTDESDTDSPLAATQELEAELTHAFQLMGLDASSFVETLRNKPIKFLADERPCVQRLAALYQSMIPPPTTDDRVESLEILGEQLSQSRFAVHILDDEGDDSETTTLSRFVSHSLRCGNHYITTTRDVPVNMPPNPVVALLLPPLSECIPGAEIRISSSTMNTSQNSMQTCVVPAANDKVGTLISPHPTRTDLHCLRMQPEVNFVTLVAVPQLSIWMMEGDQKPPNNDVVLSCLSLKSFGQGELSGGPATFAFFLTKTQSENWPVSWDAESSEPEL